MRRYITMASTKSWCGDEIGWDGSSVLADTITAYEQDAAPRPTGLLDSSGVELFSIDSRPRMGFDTTGGNMGVLAKGNRAKTASKGAKVALSPKVAVPAGRKVKSNPKKSTGKC